MESRREPTLNQRDKPAQTKKVWTAPELTEYGKVPEENPARAALGES